MTSETQRNTYGCLGILSFGTGIVTAMNGDMEIAMLCSALAPTFVALRSGIWSSEQDRILTETERNLMDTMDHNQRHNEQEFNDLFQEINRISNDRG